MVITIKDRCRVCFTCVRECPAKAIRIEHGQAEIIVGRCIGCGNCVKVCSQKAKIAVSSINEVNTLLKSEQRVAACIAPSFPAEFQEVEYKKFVGMVRMLGFDYVTEVAFGAELVARKIRELLADTNDNRYISTSCPAVFGYVTRYFPELIDNLIPVVSPMVATARALRVLYGDDLKIVFFGPCIAKKSEGYSAELEGEINAVLTFEELDYLFENFSIINGNTSIYSAPESDFDPPHAQRGNLFPLGRGLLETAHIKEDLITGEVVSASGRKNFKDAIMEFSSGDADAKFLDLLCCDGCIMGPGMTTKAPLFRRRSMVSKYTRKAIRSRNPDKWVYYMDKFRNLDLSRTFSAFDQRMQVPNEERIQRILENIGKHTPDDELNCGACGYPTCREHAIAIDQGLAETEMCLPYSIETLHSAIQELGVSNQKLADTREALIQSEKMASMGQLAAGIAHEINNPLGVVLMYAHLLLEELEKNAEHREDLEMIVSHADRAKKIVADLLNFARENKVVYKEVNIAKLIQDCLKSLTISDTICVNTNFDQLSVTKAYFDREQMMQVFINLLTNALTAMPDGGELKITARDDDSRIYFEVSDTGSGIPVEIRKRIFDPFFTTKKTGEGTGLGLAIIYGIVKMHRGDVTVKSNNDINEGPTGTTFTVSLPKKF
ncbi:GHKL domain-containing protein [candidate division KSB1 bacterium]|nr:GHKL domain-containing protein [candidate division KSB1 bacterium]